MGASRRMEPVLVKREESNSSGAIKPHESGCAHRDGDWGQVGRRAGAPGERTRRTQPAGSRVGMHGRLSLLPDNGSVLLILGMIPTVHGWLPQPVVEVARHDAATGTERPRTISSPVQKEMQDARNAGLKKLGEQLGCRRSECGEEAGKRIDPGPRTLQHHLAT